MFDLEYLDKYFKIFYTDLFYYIVEIHVFCIRLHKTDFIIAIVA